MKSIQDLSLFGESDFYENKENSINELIKDNNIIKVLKEYDLKRKDIEENWIEFLEYKEDLDICKACKSLKDCPKYLKG